MTIFTMNLKTAILIALLICVSFAGESSIGEESGNYYFVFLNTNPDRAEINEEKQTELQNAHMANIKRLYKQRKLIAAGPVVGGGGIFIMVAGSLQEARDSIRTDPAINANRFNIEIYPFSMNNGNLCWLESDNDEDYQMVTYQMVRLTPAPESQNTSLDKALAEHQQFMSKLATDSTVIIADGIFSGGEEGGILLFDVDSPEIAEKVISEHPLVKTGIVKSNTRTLWIAKETFCN